MTLMSARAAFSSPQPVENAEAEAVQLNRSALQFVLGAQAVIFEELVFLSEEMQERARTEVHLFNEFVMKMAGAHSVKDVRMMCLECGEHQLDFFRRDTERLFRHSQRMIATTSKLINGRPLN